MVAVVVDRYNPQKWHAGKKGVKPGFSYQTGKVHRDWNDFERTMKKRGESRGEEITIETENDYRKYTGRRLVFCCGEVRDKYSKCPKCKGIVGDK